MPSKMIQESAQFLMEVLKVLVLSDSITSLWLASFGLLACLDFGPCPLFLFLSLSWVLSFDKVWQRFIIMLHDKDNRLLC
jgi:hypothetical protein